MKSAEPEGTWALAALMKVCEGTSVTITHLKHLKGCGTFPTGCVHADAERWSQPSEEAAPCEPVGVQYLLAQHSLQDALCSGAWRAQKLERHLRGSGGTS